MSTTFSAVYCKREAKFGIAIGSYTCRSTFPLDLLQFLQGFLTYCSMYLDRAVIISTPPSHGDSSNRDT